MKNLMKFFLINEHGRGFVNMENLLHQKDFKNIRSLYLQLGPECNMFCRHCHQTPEKHLSCISRNLSDETKQFLEHFIQYSQREEFLSKAKNEKNLFRIMFYGGEALLHWDILKELVVFFTEKYNLLSNSVFRFALTTNGLGITKDFVDFVNKYKVHVSFSYDAPNPWAVRGFVPDSICDLVNQIKTKTIISAGSSYNCDPVLARRCLQAKFPNAKYITRMEVMRTFPEMEEDIDIYNFEKLRSSIRKLCILAKMKDKWAVGYLRALISPKLYPDSEWGYFHRTKCGNCISGRKELTVSTDGKIYFCYNSGELLGNLIDDTIDSIYEKAKQKWVNIYDPQCETCEGKEFCHWGCYILLRDKNKHAFTCEQYRKPLFKILQEELKALGKPLAEEEITWYQEQEKLMEQQVQVFLLESKRYEKEHTRLPK